MVLRLSYLLVRLLDGAATRLSRLCGLVSKLELKTEPETKRPGNWDLLDGRSPGWHRIGERAATIRSRTWDDSDIEAPRLAEPDASPDLAVLCGRARVR